MSSPSRAAGESASRPCTLKLVEVIEHPMRADATLCVALLMALVAGALMLTMRGSLIGRHLVAVYCQSTDAGRQRCEAPVLVGLMPNSTVSWSVKASTGLTLNASSWTTHEVQTALDLRHCSLRRFTQAEAQQCLAGRPIVAIGDSLTRYQYLSLVNFLDTGVWRDTASTTRSRNLTYLHAGHHDYGPYYAGKCGRCRCVNTLDALFLMRFFSCVAALSGPQYFGDRMSCDCYRTRTKFIAENHFYKGSCGVSASFYYYSGARLDEQDWPLSVVRAFFQAFLTTKLCAWNAGYPKPPMIEQLQGHFGFPPFSNKTQCTPGECNAPADWSMSLEEALQRVRVCCM